MKIALIGRGTMGKLVETAAISKGWEIKAVLGPESGAASASELSERLRGVDAVIDFSAAHAVRRNVEACMLAGVALVEGTTGWNDSIREIESVVASHRGAFVFGANFSIGVNLFYRIVGHAAELFASFPEYEIFIEEQHHSRKKDKPSGTALKLADIVAVKDRRSISVSSTRAGRIPGTHRVGFDGAFDQIMLEHVARSRDGFAAGALAAAEWIAGKKGFFEFGEIVDELTAGRPR